jgi:hypothetical protein
VIPPSYGIRDAYFVRFVVISWDDRRHGNTGD